MNKIKCPYDLNQFVLGEPIFENPWSEEECEKRKFYGDCYHCFSTAIASRDHQLKHGMSNKIKAIVDKWKTDTWTDNLSYECMQKIAYLIADDLGFTGVESYTCKDGDKMRDAIKALEQEPCEDAVSRTEIQQKINRLWNSNGDKNYCMETLKDFVTELQPVTPTQKWIPVKERLPETDGEYLLFGKVDEFDEGYYKFIGEFDAADEEFGIWGEYFYGKKLFYKYEEVLAWMPLPDDYKEGKESE